MRGLLAVLLLVIASSAGAASLGRLAVLSAIGEPLRAEIEVSVSPEELETATAHFAPPDAYPPAGLQYSPVLNGARIAIRYRHTGRRVVDIVTTRPVIEPSIQLLVVLEVRGVRIVRAYNLIIDPRGAMPRAGPAAEFPPVVVRNSAVAATSSRAPAVPRSSSPVKAAVPVVAGSNIEVEREIRRLETQLNDHAKALASMLERVAVMERQVQQLQRLFEAQSAAVAAPEAPPARIAEAAPVSSVAATAPVSAEPAKTITPAPPVPPPPVVEEVRGQTTTKIDTIPRTARGPNYLLNEALLVLAGGLLLLFVWLGYWVWGRRGAKAEAKAAPPPEAGA